MDQRGPSSEARLGAQPQAHPAVEPVLTSMPTSPSAAELGPGPRPAQHPTAPASPAMVPASLPPAAATASTSAANPAPAPAPFPTPSLPPTATASSSADTAVHRGWEISGVSTAKCDLCHNQRCGAIQKCYECKLSVCRPCSTSGRLSSDPRHMLDPDAVSWDVPAVTRRRRARPGLARGDGVDGSRGRALRDGISRRARNWSSAGLSATAGPAALTGRLLGDAVVMRSLEGEVQRAQQDAQSAAAAAGSSSSQGPSFLRGHTGPVEPRLSIAPESPYHQLPGPRPFAPQHHQREALRRGMHASRHGAMSGVPRQAQQHLRGRSLTAPISRTERPSYFVASPPVASVQFPPRRRSDSLLNTPGLPPTPRHERPFDDAEEDDDDDDDDEEDFEEDEEGGEEAWPSRMQIEALGARLAGAARSMMVLRPERGLDVHLRDEMQRFWAEAPGLVTGEGGRVGASQVLGLVGAAAGSAPVMGLGLAGRNAATEWLDEMRMRVGEDVRGERASEGGDRSLAIRGFESR